jgi:hypothetical protein
MTSKIQPLTPEFLEEEVNARGVNYRFRELSIGEYDDLVQKATTKRPNGIGGEDELIDNAVLLKLMVIKCSVDPKLSAESLSHLPMRVVMKFNATVNRMHYGDEPEKKDDDKPAGSDDSGDADEEGTAKGNAA